MILTEKVNFKIAEILSKITFSQFKYLFELSTTKRHDKYDLMGEFTKVKNYCKDIIKTNNQQKVRYGFAKNKDVGRLQSKNPSLQRLYNGIRGVLCDGLMFDIDMKNCHPCILLNLCKQHNIKFNYLLDYINNRDEFLNELMSEYDLSKSEAKSVLLSALNKTTPTTKINKKKVKSKGIFKSFDNELTEITNKLFDIYKNDKRFDKYLVNNDWNSKGKYINNILCDYENIYLQKAIVAITTELVDINDIAVLMYDGFMINACNYNIDEIINLLNDIFKKDNIEWDYKSHNIELLEEINNLVIEDNDKFVGENIIEVIDHMLNGILKDKIYKDEFTTYYITDDKILMSEKAIKSTLYDLISKQHYEMYDPYKGHGESVICSKIQRHINDIVQGILNKCSTNLDFVNDIWDFTQFKLFFNNGYYDFKLNAFINNNNNETNKTFIKINRNYNSVSNDKIRQEIYNKVLFPVFSIRSKEEDLDQYELMEYYLYICSQMLGGNVELKKWALFEGLRNSGKGVLGDILKNCFGSYVKTTNSSNFNFKTNITDSQKALSWLIDYRFARIALTSEMDISENIKLNGNMIKKFTSGGDYLSARRNFQDEIEFRIQSGLIIMCNDMPKVEPSDALEMCDEFPMKSKFIDDNFNENNKLKGYQYYKKDIEIKSTFLKRDDVIDEFILMIFEKYHTNTVYPPNLQKINQENLDDEDDYQQLFSLFELGDLNDTISNDNLKSIIKHKKIPFTLKKVKTLLKTIGAKDYRDKRFRGLQFIKEISNDDFSDDDLDE